MGGGMGNLNKAMLIGRLGSDPEMRNTGSASVVNISLATTETYKDAQGNKQEKTEWHNLVFWERNAEIVEKYCKKGSQLFVEGSLQTREWNDKDGNKRYTTEIRVRNFQMLDSKNSEQSTSSPNTNQQNLPLEDDIPF
jgi:single-strand DNA-binding protein